MEKGQDQAIELKSGTREELLLLEKGVGSCPREVYHVKIHVVVGVEKT